LVRNGKYKDSRILNTLPDINDNNVNQFAEINAYFTGQLSPEKIEAVMIGKEEIVPGLKGSAHAGRPNWDQIFTKIGDNHRGEPVGVFYCGPRYYKDGFNHVLIFLFRVLSKALYNYCTKYTSTTEGRKFIYHKENF
jgi:hypothetical protein